MHWTIFLCAFFLLINILPQHWLHSFPYMDVNELAGNKKGQWASATGTRGCRELRTHRMSLPTLPPLCLPVTTLSSCLGLCYSTVHPTPKMAAYISQFCCYRSWHVVSQSASLPLVLSPCNHSWDSDWLLWCQMFTLHPIREKGPIVQIWLPGAPMVRGTVKWSWSSPSDLCELPSILLLKPDSNFNLVTRVWFLWTFLGSE